MHKALLLLLVLLAGASRAAYTRHALPGAVCNDGSQYNYFLEEGSTSLLVFFQGGGWCYDESSCAARWSQSPSLMSSSKQPESYGSLGGIMGSSPSPFSGWTRVWLPYCTSDNFSGNASASGRRFSYLGSRVVPALLEALAARVSAAPELVVAGSSAGAEAMLVNLDLFPNATGFLDSGYFLSPSPTFSPMPCDKGSGSCTEEQGMKRGWSYWRSVAPSYEMLLGPYALPRLRSPVFVLQFGYDLVQLMHQGIFELPRSAAELTYADGLRSKLYAALEGRHGFYSPSCYKHTIARDPAYSTVRVANTSISEAWRAWRAGEPAIYKDTCEGPNCNPTCPTSNAARA